jgi:hypothetical protein
MFAASASNTKATHLGNRGALNGGADRSAAEIPRERDGTRTRDLSAKPARTVLTDWAPGAKDLNVFPTLATLDSALPSSCSLPSGELFPVGNPPRPLPLDSFRSPLIMPTEAVLQVVRLPHIESAG